MAINVGYAEIALSLILCLLIICICRWSLIRNVSVRVRNWPFLGMLPTFLKKEAFLHFHDFTAQILKQCGHTLTFKGPWTNHNFFLTSDPVNVHHILSKNFGNYPKGSDFNMIFLEGFGDGIFNSEGDSWRLQRKAIHSSLKHSKFQFALEKTLHQKIERGLIQDLEHASKKASVTDMQDVFKRFAFDIVCQLVLGFDPNCLSVEFPQLASEKAYDVIGKCLICRHMRPPSFWKLKKWLQVGMEKKYSSLL